jgi:carboxyl-terminal processing protease
VRDNPGGLIDSVAEVLDTVLPTGNIVSVEYNDGTKKVLHTSNSAQLDLPIAVLVNENSASGAELLAAAIQDYAKGKVIGMQTYGKGTMQEIYTFTDGSALQLTVAKFYPPLSGNFDGVGVTPDIPIEQSEEAKANPYFLTDEQDTQLSAGISALIVTGADVSNTASNPEGNPASKAAEVPEKSAESALTAYAPESKPTKIV